MAANRRQKKVRGHGLGDTKRCKPIEISRKEWRTYINSVRSRFRQLKLPNQFLQACSIKQKGVDNVSMREKTAFLEKTGNAVVGVIIPQGAKLKGKIGGHGRRRLISRDDIKRAEASIDAREKPEINSSVQETIKIIQQNEKKRIRLRLENHLRKYFKERHIPLRIKTEKEAFESTVNEYIRANLGQTEDYTKPLDLAKIERLYMDYKKMYKNIGQSRANAVNRLFERIFGRNGLTKNQSVVAKRWLLDKTQKPEEELVRMAETEVLPNFEDVKTRKRSSHLRPASMSIVKSGSRKARMKLHNGKKPREKNLVDKKRTPDKEKKAKSERKTVFDSVESILGEIGGENRETETILRDLRKKRLITDKTIVRLFINGSLTQKILLTILNDRGFMKAYGRGCIERLAKGLAKIGPQGRRTELSKKDFGGKNDHLFEFLIKNRYIIMHSGGSFVYLVRKH